MPEPPGKAAGSGCEVLALCRMGYAVDAFK
jgi:hypothetical protein